MVRDIGSVLGMGVHSRRVGICSEGLRVFGSDSSRLDNPHDGISKPHLTGQIKADK